MQDLPSVDDVLRQTFALPRAQRWVADFLLPRTSSSSAATLPTAASPFDQAASPQLCIHIPALPELSLTFVLLPLFSRDAVTLATALPMTSGPPLRVAFDNRSATLLAISSDFHFTLLVTSVCPPVRTGPLVARLVFPSPPDPHRPSIPISAALALARRPIVTPATPPMLPGHPLDFAVFASNLAAVTVVAPAHVARLSTPSPIWQLASSPASNSSVAARTLSLRVRVDRAAVAARCASATAAAATTSKPNLSSVTSIPITAVSVSTGSDMQQAPEGTASSDSSSRGLRTLRNREAAARSNLKRKERANALKSELEATHALIDDARRREQALRDENGMLRDLLPSRRDRTHGHERGRHEQMRGHRHGQVHGHGHSHGHGRGRDRDRGRGHGHSHGHSHGRDHGHGLSNGRDHGRSHSHARDHSHGHSHGHEHEHGHGLRRGHGHGRTHGHSIVTTTGNVPDARSARGDVGRRRVAK